jgi:hypothetical protein
MQNQISQYVKAIFHEMDKEAKPVVVTLISVNSSPSAYDTMLNERVAALSEYISNGYKLTTTSMSEIIVNGSTVKNRIVDTLVLNFE